MNHQPIGGGGSRLACSVIQSCSGAGIRDYNWPSIPDPPTGWLIYNVRYNATDPAHPEI